MDEGQDKKQEDIHLTREVTSWVHHHRKLAKWLMRILVMGLAVASYYFKKEQKHLEDEEKK